MRFRRSTGRAARPGVAALEFAIVCPILFLIFLGMVEIGRAVMVSGSVTSAARGAARAGAVTGGSYSALTAAATASLTSAGLPSGAATVTVTVNGVTVSDDASFQAAALPGATVAVTVSVPYGRVSWLPGGVTLFLSGNRTISGGCALTK